MKSNLLFNRILFFTIGLCSVLVIYFIFKISATDPSDPERIEENEKIDDAQKSSQEKWADLSTKRIQCFYRKGDKVYWSDAEVNRDDKNVPPITGADAETFKIAIGSAYAKDKNHVYWWEYDEDVEEYDEWPEGYYVPVVIMFDADPKTFRYLGGEFGCDKNKMYFRGKEIDWDKKELDFDMYNRITNLYYRFLCDDPCRYIEATSTIEEA